MQSRSAHIAELGFAFSAILFMSVAACRSVSDAGLGDQGWSDKERYTWQRGTQGSRLIPFAWLVQLEEAGSTNRLMSPANVERFGYLASAPGDSSTLPIGFAIDKTADDELGITHLRWFAGQHSQEPWVGMNCAACHTAEIRYKDQSLRVDGAPGMGDFQGFLRALTASMAATYQDPAKWQRFSAAVLAGAQHNSPPDTADNRNMLRTQFKRLLDWQQKLANLDDVALDYGPGRLDAVGHILNKVAAIADAPGQFAGPPDAPVSYPFIWNANQHDFLQWDGIAPNKAAHFPSGETFDAGALIRNTSEVIGVFADVQVAPPSLSGYRSSVNVESLDAMESQLGRLKSPSWPVSWPLDRNAAAEGRKLFEAKCASCHVHLDRDDLNTPIKAVMTPLFDTGARKGVGTDPWMACNAFTYQAQTGKFEGSPKGFIIGDKFGKQDFTRNMLTTAAVGTLFGKKRQIATTVAKAAFGLPRQIEVEVAAGQLPGQQDKATRLRDCRSNAGDRLMAYKARPLNGIWATPPYLHNGSVKSLHELLLPPAKRASSFLVGNREFDVVNVGYVDAPSPLSWPFQTANRAGQPIPGNSNLGHDYGNAGFTDAQRRALVEYMKTL